MIILVFQQVCKFVHLWFCTFTILKNICVCTVIFSIYNFLLLHYFPFSQLKKYFDTIFLLLYSCAFMRVYLETLLLFFQSILQLIRFSTVLLVFCFTFLIFFCSAFTFLLLTFFSSSCILFICQWYSFLIFLQLNLLI